LTGEVTYPNFKMAVQERADQANKGAAYWSSTVQNSLAQSSNVAFTDLAPAAEMSV